jgi:aminoglycoside phosphotransferase
MSAGIEPVNVWYIPGKALQIVYRAFPGRPNGENVDTLFRMRFFPPGRSAAHADRAAADRHRVRHVPSMDAVASLFPEDAELPQLGSVLTRRYAAEHFGVCGAWELLSYLPGRRCAVRYRFPDDDSGIVLRVQALEEASRSGRIARAAWNAKARLFRMPRPLGCDEQAGALWERFAPGQRLDALVGSARFDVALRQVVRAIVHLHALGLPDLPSEETGDILSAARSKVIPKARIALPRLRGGMDGLMPLLLARRYDVRELDPVTLHGDLHTANLLIDEEGVVFIDLDRMCIGNAAEDLAMLGTRLLLVALRSGSGMEEVAGAVALLPDLYHDAGGRRIEQATYAWYVAALLVGRQLKTVIRHLAPDVERLAATLLAWARRTLEQGRFEPSVVREG